MGFAAISVPFFLLFLVLVLFINWDFAVGNSLRKLADGDKLWGAVVGHLPNSNRDGASAK